MPVFSARLLGSFAGLRVSTSHAPQPIVKLGSLNSNHCPHNRLQELLAHVGQVHAVATSHADLGASPLAQALQISKLCTWTCGGEDLLCRDVG